MTADTRSLALTIMLLISMPLLAFGSMYCVHAYDTVRKAGEKLEYDPLEPLPGVCYLVGLWCLCVGLSFLFDDMVMQLFSVVSVLSFPFLFSLTIGVCVAYSPMIYEGLLLLTDSKPEQITNLPTIRDPAQPTQYDDMKKPNLTVPRPSPNMTFREAVELRKIAHAFAEYSKAVDAGRSAVQAESTAIRARIDQEAAMQELEDTDKILGTKKAQRERIYLEAMEELRQAREAAEEARRKDEPKEGLDLDDLPPDQQEIAREFQSRVNRGRLKDVLDRQIEERIKEMTGGRPENLTEEQREEIKHLRELAEEMLEQSVKNA